MQQVYVAGCSGCLIAPVCLCKTSTRERDHHSEQTYSHLHFNSVHRHCRSNNMDRRPTYVDYSEPQWSWPSWKFNIPLDDLFGNLFDQYNKIDIAIQEPAAFHHDVFEASSIATTKDEFHALLKERREQRVRELRKCWSSVAIGIAANPPLLEAVQDEASITERWLAFLHFSREFSFDALARYFSLFIPSERSSPVALPPSAFPPSSSESLHSRRTSPSSASKMISSTALRQQSRKRTLSEVTSIGSDNSDEDGRRVKKIRSLKNEQPISNAKAGGTLGGVGPVERRSSKTRPAISPFPTIKSGDPHPVRRSPRIAAHGQVSGRGTPIMQKNQDGAMKGRTDIRINSQTTQETPNGQRRQRKGRKTLAHNSEA